MVLLLFLSLPLSLGGDLRRKMHNMFYLPCGNHKIFTSSSHYSQSESRRALEPSLLNMPPPRAARSSACLHAAAGTHTSTSGLGDTPGSAG